MSPPSKGLPRPLFLNQHLCLHCFPLPYRLVFIAHLTTCPCGLCLRFPPPPPSREPPHLQPSPLGFCSHLHPSVPTGPAAPACPGAAHPFPPKHPGLRMKEGDSWTPQSPQSRAPGCFNAHVCSGDQRALTSAVLVPGVAADGLHQEAVVGHGFSAPVPKGEEPSQPCPCYRLGPS